MTVGVGLLRGVVGALFVGHGTQKLFGWFGGHGIGGTGAFFESLGLRPGRRHAVAAGAAEATGGALLAAGALTPLAATLISSTMMTAIRKVHAPKGPWVDNGGYEYNLTLIAAMTALADLGPGPLSVDARRFPRLHGPAWAALSLAAATAGSHLATEAFNQAPRQSAAWTEPPAAQEQTGRDATGRFVEAADRARSEQQETATAR